MKDTRCSSMKLNTKNILIESSRTQAVFPIAGVDVQKV